MNSVADRYFEAYNALLVMGKTKCQTFCREMAVGCELLSKLYL